MKAQQRKVGNHIALAKFTKLLLSSCWYSSGCHRLLL